MIKRVINTNISLQDAFTNMIETSVANILVQKGIENGDASPVSDLGDVKKKGTGGNVVSVDNFTCKVKTTSGEIIDVVTQDGFIYHQLQVGANVSIDYDENGEAYLLNTIPHPKISQLITNKFELLAQSIGSESPTINIATYDGNSIKSRILMKVDGIDIGMNSESLGGLIIIEKLTEKLNDALKAVKELELKLNTHIHGVSGTVTTTPTTPPATKVTQLPLFNKNNYENKNVTHS